MTSTPAAFPFRISFPPELPISARAEEITAAIHAHPVVILAGETGSGKTTQIPKLCLAAGRGVKGRIACTQPRRVAALSVSRRVAEELGVAWGREVGCKVRFNDETTAATRIKFLTDGMLLAEAQGDPMLREYDTIIVDEAHERSLNIDFLLGHLRQLRTARPDLKIIVTSATIDTAAFSAAFGSAPVITVEGRTFPVEVIYAPLDSFGSDAEPESADDAEKAEALHYIDGAVEAVRRIVRESDAGDILVFLPSERDVREVCDLVSGGEVVPLFGRLSNAEQQRVFAASPRRKIVVATNIAETSLTIPGIRYVVDTGLARVSRYVPQARTRRLPIEPIAQASADQRKGRCGRVANGVCIRLYSEQDYNGRPRYAAPEIQRANLADVILKLKAFDFGAVEDFPFLTPPLPKAVKAGYALLDELGALREGVLTPVGRELARLPVDPTIGRMILQARTEQALREVLVIAAGLSVQDPRERPLDRQAQADAAHRQFVHPDSDFLGLLRIWDKYHGQFEQMTQAKLRRFGKEHYLSYTRMREWRDVHAQLEEALRERRDFRPSSAEGEGEIKFGSPGYRAIHRSILAGLLGNLATWDDANGGFKATHDRKVVLFPGSALFRRDGKGKGPRWIVAAEIVETSRVYARNCAKIDPAWALDLAAHLVKVAHSEPYWDQAAGRVKVRQRTRLYGLEIDSRGVAYGRIAPREATEIFIREGLVNDTISFPLRFLDHNRQVRERVVERLTRARHSGYLNLDENLYRFYAARIDGAKDDGVSSVAELVDLVRKRQAAEPQFLELKESDLIGPDQPDVDEGAFPPSVPLENRALPLQYAYRPGQEDDGVTLEVNLQHARELTEAAVDWAVPGYLAEKVEHYLRALPKELRRGFVPLGESARRLSEALLSRHRLTGGRETVREALSAQIREQFQLAIPPALWAAQPPPDHLRVRIKVQDAEGKVVVASRDWAEIAGALKPLGIAAPVKAEPPQSRHAGQRLAEELKYEIAWLEKDLKKVREVGALAATLAPIEQLQADAFALLKARMLAASSAEAAKEEIRRETPRFLATLRGILELRQDLLVMPAREKYAGLDDDLQRLVPPEFLRLTPWDRFWHLPRYLKAMKLRAERSKQNAAKDAERVRRLAPYIRASGDARWLVEEYRVSLFAQELGTSEPVSSVKLDQAMKAAAGVAQPAKPAAAPVVAKLPVSGEKQSLKSFSALDKIFTK